MAYRIDPTPHADRRYGRRGDCEATIVLVGCGGTGGFLAEAIARLLIGRSAQLFLVDPDRADVGRFKAEVLAERLARRFGREIGYSVLPYDRELHAQVFGRTASRLNLLIGCVDTAAARRAFAATLDQPPSNANVWWLDAGNGKNSGQVLLGNATRPDELRGAFDRDTSLCHALPAPSLQRPDLLEALPEPTLTLDCADAVVQDEQGATINQIMAAVAASYLEKLLTDTAHWMATYLDMDEGTLRCVPADPKIVADITGLHLTAVAARSAA